MIPTNVDLICFSHLRWGFVFQRPQHLMSRFARDRRVFFFEEPVFEDAQAHLRASVCPTTGVRVNTPVLPHGLTQQQITYCQIALLRAMLAQNSITDYIAWYYTPMALEFSSLLRPSVTIYDCMDELSAFAGAPAEMRLNEAALFCRADLVFTGGASLFESKRMQHQSVHLFPSSVDVAHFSRARSMRQDADDQAHLPRPRLGYAGVIDERMDLDLLRQVALERPNWQFVILGPIVKIDPALLPRAANVHYLGMKPYSDLPCYFGGWDIGLLPFALNESTRFISPTKTPEYLAAGLRVVSAPIRDVVSPYGELGLVRIAKDANEFIRATDSLLANPPETNFFTHVDQFLSLSSWDKTWIKMSELIEDRLAVKRLQTRPAIRRKLHVPLQRTYPIFDYLIVGAGFAGCVVAEKMARCHGKKVLLIDRRDHIGGNAYDHYNEDGILIHRYGPHIFHTNSEQVFEYLSQFTAWRGYEHRVLAYVDGKLVPIPINLDTVNLLFGLNLTSESEVEAFFASCAEFRPSIRTSEDVVVSKVGRYLYERLFRNYTRKQWGKDPSELDASVTARIPVRTNRDDRYFTDRYQAMPKHGYTRLFENMLDHSNITIELGCDFREAMKEIKSREVIYTGPIDEFFDFRFGELPYRSLRFRHETLDTEYSQRVAVINYPNEHSYTRVTEFKHLTGQCHRRTGVVYEYPASKGDPYYPIPTPETAALYKRYAELAAANKRAHFVGRLATYRYYNMDQVVAQALTLCKHLAAAPDFAVKQNMASAAVPSVLQARPAVAI